MINRHQNVTNFDGQGGTIRFWPFRQPLTYADTLTFFLSILAAIVGVIIGLVEQSWAFAAIAFLLGVATFQEYWTRVERLSAIAIQQENIVALASNAPETIRNAVATDMERILNERLSGVGAQIRLFENKEEFLKDKAKRIALVRKEILDTGFNYYRELMPDSTGYQAEYSEQLRRKISKENVVFRKVLYVNNLEQLNNLVAKLEKEKGHRYYLGCYVGIPESVPFLECMVFDYEEAYIGGYRGRDWSLGEFNVLIRDPAIVKVLADYHLFLWEKSIQLNGGKGDLIYYDRVDKIRKQLTLASEAKEVRVIGEREITYESLSQGLANAVHIIDVVSFQQLITRDEHRIAYYQEIEAAIQRHVTHRRIIWNSDHVRWIRDWLKKFEDTSYLEVRFYDEEKQPRIQVTFDIIDKEKCILLQGIIPPYIVEITVPEFTDLMSNYFEKLWGRSESMVLKDYHKGVNWGLLEQLEKRFGIVNPLEHEKKD